MCGYPLCNSCKNLRPESQILSLTPENLPWNLVEFILLETSLCMMVFVNLTALLEKASESLEISSWTRWNVDYETGAQWGEILKS